MHLAQRIALGLSSSAWPIIQNLQDRNHVDKIALTVGAASTLANKPEHLIVDSATEIFEKYWHGDSVFLVVGAVGAVVRLVAPLLQGKNIDPAVLVIDAKGLNLIPLLGGHQAGAEDLAIQIAEDLGGKAFLTGDARTQDRLFIDTFGEAWGWKRCSKAKKWNELMFKQSQGLHLKCFQQTGSCLWQETLSAQKTFYFYRGDVSCDSDGALFVGSKLNREVCCWHPPTLWIGVGCERNTSFSLIERSLGEALIAAGLAEEAVVGIATIDKKSDETGLITLLNKKNWLIRFFKPHALNEVDVPSPSEVVKKVMDTSSVAEASALLAAGNGGELVLRKTIFYPKNSFESGALTVAIAEAKVPFAPQRGELHLIGSGPGELAYLTHDAKQALARSAIWIGYKYYLDFLEPLRTSGQARIDGVLTFEKDRCEKALELASQGIRVALISSGDSGIYGMAGLALELLLEKPKNDRPLFQVHPGVSALQMAASRIGAPLMHDFCTISLSDRMISWTRIKERLIGAAMGDFVIGLYNPQSKKRDWQLKEAISVLLDYRPGSTPVVLARQIGRPQEQVQMHTLESIPINEVDMFTILIIGNNTSTHKEGWFLTPRGY